MTSGQLDEERIFHIARQIPVPEARDGYLDQICAGDQAMRERVEALLEVHEKEQEFLKSSPEPAPTVDHTSLTERPGTTIGRYKLMEQIGEGGMGTVFVAEQERPIRRKVALKVIKPGMDSKAVVARFEAERQALAMMDHPNIAKVLDAGTTESGRPYFAMELVKGIPITEYCDKNKLTIRERLDLFIQVCQAIQHAHQKGIIHRDIKPSNVLVTLHDGKPVPKVIDFGVAKALNARLTDKTIYTEHLQVVGTLLYMSPEQAELSGLDVDTRSDVYSLGVLLYELLTGTTPFQKAELDQAGFDEQRRIIRETDPPRASQRISGLGETATAVAEHRKTDPKKLHQLVRGELDWIVGKALEKDRTQRYATPGGFADDIQRFLTDEPIIARFPSLAYRCRKFARRNRVAMATSGLVLTLLLLAIVSTTSLLLRARQTLALLANAALEEAVTAALSGSNEKAVLALSVAHGAGASQERIALLRGLMALNDGQNKAAIHFADESLASTSSDDESLRIGARSLRATACVYAGYDEQWERELEQLGHLHPTSDTDHLLKAYALVLADPTTALEISQRIQSVHRSPVGLFIRAEARYFQAVETQDAELLSDAVRDFEYVQFLFGDSFGSIGWRLLASAAAIELAKSEGRIEDVERFRRAGLPAARQLDKAIGHPGCDYDRWLFYRAIGETEKASRAIQGVGGNTNSYALFLAADCLGVPDAASALREFNQVFDDRPDETSPWYRIAQAHLVRDLPDGEAEVRRLVDGLVSDRSVLICRHALLALCLVDTPEIIDGVAKQARRNVADSYRDGDIFNGGDCLDYLSGQLKEADLLQSVGGRGFAMANAHFNIAMMRLAAGDREGAHEHLRRCVATNAIGSFDYELGRGYLTRMESNDDWPAWVGNGKAEQN